MSDNGRSRVVKNIAQTAGMFAGATVGWQAGEAIGHELATNLPPSMEGHTGFVTDATAIVGAFGCAVAGYAVATRKPAEAILVAAAAIASNRLIGGVGSHNDSADASDMIAAPPPEAMHPAVTQAHINHVHHHIHHDVPADIRYDDHSSLIA